jgi:hypothetical protein
MANINVKDLSGNITGSDLFSDSESFMRDLSDYELNTQGASIGAAIWAIARWVSPRLK